MRVICFKPRTLFIAYMPRKNRQQKLSAMPQRLLWLDMLRGFAIVLMIIFHFCYDLRYFGYVDWHIPNGPNWWPFRYFILTLFIFTVGMSLSLAHHPQFKRISFVKRLVQLGLAALAITLMSLIMFPHAWIYFGILHFIALASLIGVPFISRPRIALFLALVILFGYWFGMLGNEWPFNLFADWLPDDTEDYVPLFPWLGVMLLGIGFAGIVLPQMASRSKQHTKKIKPWDLPNITINRVLAWLGKRGLIIYLIHQPILFACFYLVQWLF